MKPCDWLMEIRNLNTYIYYYHKFDAVSSKYKVAVSALEIKKQVGNACLNFSPLGLLWGRSVGTLSAKKPPHDKIHQHSRQKPNRLFRLTASLLCQAGRGRLRIAEHSARLVVFQVLLASNTQL